jgi:hypothetical protein
MYSVLPSFIIGFHGCDETVAEKILAGQDTLRKSTNSYDWLGHGIYFWENNPQRALEYAESIKAYPARCKEKITKPAVIGAIINLGHCLNLLDAKYLQHVREAYHLLHLASQTANQKLPQNKNIKDSKDLLLRPLDCMVIEEVHRIREALKGEGREAYTFDTVRAVFVEGDELYENSGFRDKNHLQVCVRNPNCIKGYFRVLKPDENFPLL